VTMVRAGCGLVVRRSVTALRSSTSIPIGGGHDRGIGFEPLAAGRAVRDTPALVLAIPGSGPRIQAAIEAGGPGRVEVDALFRPDAVPWIRARRALTVCE